MKHIFDDGEARGTVLRFARLSSELLAWGATDGSVRVAELGNTPRILHVRPFRILHMIRLYTITFFNINTGCLSPADTNTDVFTV